jgi:hypothetical protein
MYKKYTSSFFAINFRFLLFYRKNICAKVARKILVKLTPEGNSFVQVAVFDGNGHNNPRYEHQICLLEVLFAHFVCSHDALKKENLSRRTFWHE